MKKFLFFLVVLSASVFAQDLIGEKLNTTIEKLFSVSKLRDYNAVCDLIVFTGSDESRNLQSKLNSKNDEELQQAERIAKKIKAYIDISDSYEITSTEKVTEEGKEFLHAKLEFKSGNQILEIVFKFIGIDENLLLVEID